MIITDTTGLHLSQVIIIACDKCSSKFERTLKNHNQRKKRAGCDLCNTCSRRAGARKRPQNSRTFLQSISKTPAYYQGIKRRPSIAGENNPQWGRSPSKETRAKMSKSRTGKIGVRATGWKGGKFSFNHRIKTAIQRRYKWFHRVIDRDGGCVKCKRITQLDAHHKIPISTLIKQITHDKNFNTDDDKFEYVIAHPLIVDDTLENGVALCRACHKIEHKNWGSHEPKT